MCARLHRREQSKRKALRSSNFTRQRILASPLARGRSVGGRGRGGGETTAGERRRVAHATNGRAARRWDGAGLSATYGDGD